MFVSPHFIRSSASYNVAVIQQLNSTKVKLANPVYRMKIRCTLVELWPFVGFLLFFLGKP